ncbi:MAG: hypothetical protein NZM12_04770, partial [Steroidobacteraceae bacterium]|nr:hypothetical protein [Steroidobacteraceae bacterium]MDW8258758.1 hypothetical protein [Gammaproteobacteria bacterium]
LALLSALGFGLDFAAVESGARYRYRSGAGFERVARGPFDGAHLLAIAARDWRRAETLETARHLLSAALAHCLEGRELRTRAVARAIHEHTRF